MIKISILYPNHEDGQFDMVYYLDIHMPMVIERFSRHDGFKGVSVERGLTGIVAGLEADYVAMCHFLFDSVDASKAAFDTHAEALRDERLNYTDIEPIIQISEVAICR